MYEILLFSGGVYKFNEFKEFIDDIGGLIIEMESFKISRGMYFLSEEMKVLIVVPMKEQKEVEILAKEIKGNVEPVLMENTEKEKVALVFEIYKNLKINKAISLDNLIKNLSNTSNFIQLKSCEISNPFEQEDFLEKLTELLFIMEKMKIIKKIEKEDSLYYKIKVE